MGREEGENEEKSRRRRRTGMLLNANQRLTQSSML